MKRTNVRATDNEQNLPPMAFFAVE